MLARERVKQGVNRPSPGAASARGEQYNTTTWPCEDVVIEAAVERQADEEAVVARVGGGRGVLGGAAQVDIERNV